MALEALKYESNDVKGSKPDDVRFKTKSEALVSFAWRMWGQRGVKPTVAQGPSRWEGPQCVCAVVKLSGEWGRDV